MRYSFIPILLLLLTRLPVLAQDEPVEEEPIDERFTIDTPVILDLDTEKGQEKGVLRGENPEGVYAQRHGKSRVLRTVLRPQKAGKTTDLRSRYLLVRLYPQGDPENGKIRSGKGRIAARAIPEAAG